MLQVQSICINENLVNNSRSDITLLCNTHKGFESLTNNVSSRNLLNGKVNYDKFEIRISLYCLNDGMVQLADEEGYIPLDGRLWLAKDDSVSYINLTAEINRTNWLKFKSDILAISLEKISIYVNHLRFERIYEDEECYESNVKLSLHKYCMKLP